MLRFCDSRPTSMSDLALRVAIVWLAMAPCSALAGDGAHEINQTCATQTGCFAGDAPGFPVTITQISSYLLTSDLRLTSADQSAIDASTVAPVTIDLGGFSIEGVTFCVGFPVTSCSPTGTGVGIKALGATVIRNGHVGRMGSEGISAGFSARVESVSVYSNGTFGITVGDQSTISDVTVFSNGLNGIRVGRRSLVSGSTVTGNLAVGITSELSPSHANVERCTVAENGSRGIFLFGYDFIHHNVVNANHAGGIGFGSAPGVRSRITDNMFMSNTGCDLCNLGHDATNNSCTAGPC